MKHTEYAGYLSETAILMGVSAKAATEGDWSHAYGEVYANGRMLLVADAFVDGDGEYIASWHPPIAASVADMLISVAVDIEANGEKYALTSTTVARAVKLAQRWRRESAPE